MATATSFSQNARETAKDAREGVREVGNAAAAASGDIQKDLQALRDDFSRLAEQVAEILTGKGNAAWLRAKASVDGVVSEARDTGREAMGTVRDVSGDLIEAVDETIKQRPYATLALVAGLGFLFGATWRR